MKTVRNLIGTAIMAAAIVSMAACGNKTKDNQDGAAAADSISEGMAAQADEDIVLMETPDLTLYALKGNVKTAVTKGTLREADGELQSLAFDEQGRLTRIDDYSISYAKVEGGKVTKAGGNNVKRDKQGRITAVDCADGCSGQMGRHYKYTKNGYECDYDYGECSGLYVEKVTTDDDGLPVKAEGASYDESGEWEVTYTYTYTKFDEKGNWTERKVKWNDKYTEYDETEDGTPNNTVKEDGGTVTQARTITYHGE